jgi:glycerol-3-phosphate dehydrogenase (NAD(P)+)
MAEINTTIIGAGSWGTALAIHSANRGHKVQLWAHSPDTLRALVENRENSIYLRGFKLPDSVVVTSDPSCVAGSQYVVFVVPSIYFCETFIRFLPHLRKGTPLISAIKGMEPDTSKRISQIVQEISGNDFVYSVLSGPSFAREVVQQHPTAVVIGTRDEEVGKRIQSDFSSRYFRLYYNIDVLGIEIGASVKNIIAIAAGVVHGLGYGYNTTSGLITRGLAEMNRFAVALGALPATLNGLAGLGDLILTCTGELSRNRQVGVELGKGKSIADITSGMRMVAEGIRTTQAVQTLSQQRKISMPITDQVYRLLYQKQDPRAAILELMSRELKQE